MKHKVYFYSEVEPWPDPIWLPLWATLRFVSFHSDVIEKCLMTTPDTAFQKDSQPPTATLRWGLVLQGDNQTLVTYYKDFWSVLTLLDLEKKTIK